jgi:hypothetical protein
MFSECGSWTVYSWLGQDRSHHDLSHAPDSDLDSRAQLVAINEWLAGQVSAFATRLGELPGYAGSVLDETMVWWLNDLGRGNLHTVTQVPHVVVGDCGGALRTGQVVDAGGRYHNDLLLAVCHAMQVELGTFGAPEANTGPLPILA